MSYVQKELSEKDTAKYSNNFSEEEIKILESLNLSSNDNKNKKSDSSKENENKILGDENNHNKINENNDIEKKNKYIKKYKTNDSRLYGITFQNSIENNIINVAVSSLNMNTNNHISILSFSEDNLNYENNEEDNINIINNYNENNINSVNNNSILFKSQVQCDFPVSSILFSPHEQNKNLLVSTSDILRLYSYEKEQLSLKVAFKKRRKDYCGPLTACDWSKVNNSIIGVCSVDTTCAIWDLNKLEVKYMIIAHDKEVYDISLGQDEFTFMSTGADGSVRLFDSRTANSSSIIFETRDESPMIRLKWNSVNPNFILTVIVDKNEIYILDQRKLTSPYAILKVHTNVVNNAIWAPQSNSNLISVSDDKTALLWDVYCDSDQPEEYFMKYDADFEIENVAWGELTQNWVGIIDGNQVEILRIQ
jgi:WD repeat-containing protein 68